MSAARGAEGAGTSIRRPIRTCPSASSRRRNASAAEFAKALAGNPDSAPLAHALGLSLIRQKRLDEALARL
jgi:Flp pilus assembly protein TadD